MSSKPIFVWTHPRACSTAFERVFMTQRDTLQCIHEPFGDAFYFGPERMGSRYESNQQARQESGYAESTFKTIVDRIDQEGATGKRRLAKEMAYYLQPPRDQAPRIAPSLQHLKRGVGTEEAKPVANGTAKNGSLPFPYATEAEPGNPTIMPKAWYEQFHFTFLIRHPKASIPSYIRCCSPPLVDRTGWSEFMPEEAGYAELRRLFDWCREQGFIGPKIADREGGESGDVEICVIDADDLLDDPESIIRKYCKSVGLPFTPSMLVWDDEESHQYAKTTFEKWNGWHDDAINSKDLKPRQHKKAPKTDEQLYAEWKEKFGQKEADLIKQTVVDNVAHYEYLKQFAIKP